MILPVSAAQGLLAMTPSTGKPQSLVPQTHPLKAGSSSSTSTSPQITPLSHQNLPSLQESTTQTSTVMVPYALTYFGPSGHQHSLYQRCSYLSVLSSVTPTQMTPLFQKSPGCTRQTHTSTMSVQGNGRGSMPCEANFKRRRAAHLKQTNLLLLHCAPGLS